MDELDSRCSVSGSYIAFRNDCRLERVSLMVHTHPCGVSISVPVEALGKILCTMGAAKRRKANKGCNTIMAQTIQKMHNLFVMGYSLFIKYSIYLGML